jgi:hypothetical protein
MERLQVIYLCIYFLEGNKGSNNNNLLKGTEFIYNILIQYKNVKKR